MAHLESGNHAALTEFILLGLTDDPVLRVVLFIIILCIYLVTVSGNLSTILLIRVSSQLHQPMYIFLSHLASTDIGLSSSVTPNMLVNFLEIQSTISYLECYIQVGSAAFLGHLNASFWLPWLMNASEQFATHCFIQPKCPHKFVFNLGVFFNNTSFTLSFLSFVFCGPNRVNHFFCDFAPLVELSCSDVSVSAVVTSFSAASVTMITVLVIVVSYTYILITILKMRSTKGPQKAFSTCTSHLNAVTLYYGTVIFICVIPKSSYSTDQNKVLSVFYMVVIPMLNTLIYSLRNNEIKGALKRQLHKKIFS